MNQSKNVNLDCGVCFNRYSEVGDSIPLVLPCGHTYCKGCIENLYSHVCPTCKHPIHASGECHADLPPNFFAISCLGDHCDAKVEMKINKEFKTRESVGAPKVKPAGQRVLFKRLDKALRNAVQSRPSGEDSRLEERVYLLNLSRISRERKAQDVNFDAKRFVTHGLVSKFGEETARRILQEVFGRIHVLRQQNAMPVSTAVTV